MTSGVARLVQLLCEGNLLCLLGCSSAIRCPITHPLIPAIMSSFSLRAWTRARQEDIQQAYDDTQSWTALDEITRNHNYKFNSIAAWPFDACLICSPTSQAAVLLGSLQAACNLVSIKEELGVSITVVVSMCKNEMNIEGAPPCWKKYFKQQNAVHIQCQLEDYTVKQPQRDVNEHRALRKDCLSAWKCICSQLWQQSIAAVIAEKPMNVLFHCFGGINRSAGILCAWLIVACGYSAEEAIQLLLKKRPSLRPWRHRDYVIDALWMVEQDRLQWHNDFSMESAQVRRK